MGQARSRRQHQAGGIATESVGWVEFFTRPNNRERPWACWVSRRARPNIRFYVNLILFRGEPGPERGAAVHDVGERLALPGHVAKDGLVALVVAHELERGALDRLPARHDPDQHADPIAVLSPAMAGIE